MSICVDVAGASRGGAARFLLELDRFISSGPVPNNVAVIGRGQQLTPSWLLRREHRARAARMKIALNNASFVGPGGTRIALLRNALHFCDPDELSRLSFRPSASLRAQIPVIRSAARRADILVVPCTAMADRVTAHEPALHSRLVVRHHPVTPPRWAGSKASNEGSILVPIVPSPYKNLDKHLKALLVATEGIRHRRVTITVTARPHHFPQIAGASRLNFIGNQSAQSLDRFWRDSQAVFFPTSLESFGYPLAEARVAGRHVIAQDTLQNREIAGGALCGFTLSEPDTLRVAVERALSGYPRSDAAPFDPEDYFAWLLAGAGRGRRSA